MSKNSEYWRPAVQQAAEQMVDDIVDTVNDAIAKALRGQVARVYNPVAAALLGATGFHYLGPITNHPGGDTAQDGEVRWVQHIKFTDIKLEVRKDGNNVFVRLIDEPDAIDLAIRNAIDQAAAEMAPYLKNAILTPAPQQGGRIMRPRTFTTVTDAISYVAGHLEAYTRMVDVDADVLREIAEDAVRWDWDSTSPDELVDRAITLLEDRADELGIGLQH